PFPRRPACCTRRRTSISPPRWPRRLSTEQRGVHLGRPVRGLLDVGTTSQLGVPTDRPSWSHRRIPRGIGRPRLLRLPGLLVEGTPAEFTRDWHVLDVLDPPGDPLFDERTPCRLLHSQPC